jgi:hypothetical protein
MNCSRGPIDETRNCPMSRISAWERKAIARQPRKVQLVVMAYYALCEADEIDTRVGEPFWKIARSALLSVLTEMTGVTFRGDK